MKTHIKTIAHAIIIIALISSSFTGISKSLDPKKFKSGLKYDIEKNDENLSFQIFLDQPYNKLAMIKIYSKEGYELAKLFTSKKNFSHQFDLKSYGYGDYIVKVTSEGETIKYKIHFDLPEIFKPKILVKHYPEENIVVIFGRNLATDTYLSIRDSKGNCVYKTKIEKKDFNEKINIKNLKWGDYIVYTSNEDLNEKTIIKKR